MSDKFDSSSDIRIRFSHEAVAEWVDLLKHSKTAAIAVNCLVYISNAIVKERLNPLRVQISTIGEKNSERSSYIRVGDIPLSESKRIDVFSLNEWLYLDDFNQHHANQFLKFIENNSTGSWSYRDFDPIKFSARYIFRTRHHKAAWSDVVQFDETEESIVKLRTFLSSNGNNVTTKSVEQLLDAIISIGYGYHIERASPLHEAVKSRDLDAVIMLLSHGVNVDSVNALSYTALHYAVKDDCAIMAKTLLLFGARPIVVRIVDETTNKKEKKEEKEKEHEENDENNEEVEGNELGDAGDDVRDVQDQEEEEENNNNGEEEEIEEDEDENKDEGDNSEEEELGDEEEKEADEKEEKDDDDSMEDKDDEENREYVEHLSVKHARSDAMKDVIRIATIPAKLSNDDIEDLPKHDHEDAEKTHLLSLDGGGIRGLILTTILTELDREIPGIVDRCSWTAGTSTGCILALALAHGKTLDECRNIYFKFKDVVFTPSPEGTIDYDVTILEKFLQKTFKDDYGEPMTMHDLGENSGRKLIATTVDKTGETFNTRLLTSFTMPGSNKKGRESPDPGIDLRLHERAPCDIPAWEAARCSSAAPTYFKSYKDYSDGGLKVNNPTEVLIDEWASYENAIKKLIKKSIQDNDDREVERPTKLGAVISIGTGRKVAEKKGFMKDAFEYLGLERLAGLAGMVQLGKAFYREIAKSDGDVVRNSKKATKTHDGFYFRFTPVFKEEIGLDETNNETLIEMMWAAKAYMRKEVKNIEMLKKVVLRKGE